MVLAVALMSSGVIFSNLLAEAALRHALDQATPEKANFSIRVYSGQDAPPTAAGRAFAHRASLDFIQRRVTERFQPYLRDQTRLLETSTFFFAGHPQLELANNLRPRGGIKYMAGLLPGRIEVVQGHLPYTFSPLPSSPPLVRGDGRTLQSVPLEVAVDTLGAKLLRLGVGDELEIFLPGPTNDTTSMRARIVGVFRRLDPSDEFWYGTNRDFSFKDDQWTIVPLFTTEDAILEQVLPVYPTLYTDVTWFFYLDRHKIRARDVGALQDIVLSVTHDVHSNLRNSGAAIDLDKVLNEYEDQLLLARIPLFLMVLLVVGILTYYLALVAGLIVRSRATEISMLKSRGATTWQVGLLALVEGLLLAVPAVALGPFLALGLVQALGRVFFGLGGSQGLVPVPVVISSQAFLLGAAGGVLAVIVLTLSTLAVARQGIVEFRQMGARPPQVPFIHRYYLDFLLLALIGLLWWQIESRGAFLVRPLGSRGLEMDFTLLLGPLLGLLALGLLVLRFFPIAAALVARVAGPVGPAWLVHGLRRVSRDPVIPGTLVVLLMLATALGVVGSAFSSTLERSQRDRVMYATGADLRFQHNGDWTPLSSLGLADLVGGMGAVGGATEVQRTGGYVTTKGFGHSADLLAVDVDRFAGTAWYRPDFARGKPLTELMQTLTPIPPFEERKAGIGPENRGNSGGVGLPPKTTALALWVHPGRPDSRLSLKARLQDARGYYFDIALGDLNSRGWKRLEAGLSPLSPPGPRLRDRAEAQVTPPFTLLAFFLASTISVPEPGALFLGELAAVTPEGEQLLTDFQTLDGWHVVEDYSRPGLYALELSESVSRTGKGKSAVFSWAPGGIGARGIRSGGPETPIPAIVNPSFLEVAQARVGDTVTMGISTFSVPLKVAAVADYFPTLYPEKEPFAVVDLRTFNHYANLHNPRPAGGANELWVRWKSPPTPLSPGREGGDSLKSASPGDSRDATAITKLLDGRGISVRQTHLASELVSRRVEQPLVNASWGGLLVLMFLALVLASTSGIMLSSYMDTRERQTEFGLLRALGYSRRQLNSVVWFNLVLVVACGIGLGTWVGQQTGASLLPLLEVAEEGSRVTPPMVLQTNWTSLLVSYLALAGITVGTVAWLAWFSARLEVQQVLRMGEA
jgi:ABC-type lipoprotein release transport system permease subunit